MRAISKRGANPETSARLSWHAGLARLKGEGKRSEGGGIVASADALPLIAAAVRRVAQRVENS